MATAKYFQNIFLNLPWNFSRFLRTYFSSGKRAPFFILFFLVGGGRLYSVFTPSKNFRKFFIYRKSFIISFHSRSKLKRKKKRQFAKEKICSMNKIFAWSPRICAFEKSIPFLATIVRCFPPETLHNSQTVGVRKGGKLKQKHQRGGLKLGKYAHILPTLEEINCTFFFQLLGFLLSMLNPSSPALLSFLFYNMGF